MNTTKRTRRLALTMMGAALAMIGLSLAGNTGPTCVPVEPEPFACRSADDCDGLAAPEDCEGSFACIDGGCVWRCEEEPPGCASDRDCGPGRICVLTDLADCCGPTELCSPEVPICRGQCIDEPFACQTDDDCQRGERCVQDWVDCGPPPGCEPGDDCIAVCGPPMLVGSHCEPIDPDGCLRDADCGPSAMCVFPEGDGCCPIDANCGDFQPICVGDCVPLPPRPCSGDAQCAPGETCVGPEDVDCCMADEPCFFYRPICAGVCLPVEPPPVTGCLAEGAACASDEICVPENDFCCGPGDEICLFVWPVCAGVCVPDLPPPPPEGCLDDADCAPGERCEIRLTDGCCPPNAYCILTMPPCEGTCVPHEPAECTADRDCGADQRCALDWDICAYNCGPMENCGPCVGTCVPIEECLDDADCPDGTVCDLDDFGVCELPVDCGPDADCVSPCIGVCREPLPIWFAG